MLIHFAATVRRARSSNPPSLVYYRMNPPLQRAISGLPRSECVEILLQKEEPLKRYGSLLPDENEAEKALILLKDRSGNPIRFTIVDRDMGQDLEILEKISEPWEDPCTLEELRDFSLRNFWQRILHRTREIAYKPR